jgi:hypothetical protein
MEVCGQLQAPAALSQGKENSSLRIECKGGWASLDDAVQKRTDAASAENWTQIPR